MCSQFVIMLLLILAGCADHRDRPSLAPGQITELDTIPFFPQKKYQCGPAALATLLSASRVVVTPDILVPQVYIPGRKGSLQPELVAASRRYGRIPYIIDGELSSLYEELKGGRPILVLQNLGLDIIPVYHYAVVTAMVGGDKIVLRSGTKKRLVMDTRKFLTTWRRTDSWGMIILKPGELPENSDPLKYLRTVNSFERTGNVKQAEKAYRAAVKRWPQHQTAIFALGNNYLAQEKYDKAAMIYQKLLSINPENLAAANNLAESLVRRGCLGRGSDVIGQAVALAKKINSPLKNTIIETQQEIAQQLERGESKIEKDCAGSL